MEQIKKYLITREGLAKLEVELRELIDVKRPEVIKLIQNARDLGDLSENADYDAAKNQQAEIEGRIAEIQNIINYAEIIEEKEDDLNSVVKVGSKVTIIDLSDQVEMTYEIVGEIEADPDLNKISNLSPLAKAIIGKHNFAIAEVHNVEEPYRVKIIKIEN